MKRLGLRFVPHAVEQLDAADAWWRANREKAPDLLTREFIAAVEAPCGRPALGADYASEVLRDVKRYLLRRTRFHVYYVVRDDTLIVVALWSAIRGHGPPLSVVP